MWLSCGGAKRKVFRERLFGRLKPLVDGSMRGNGAVQNRAFLRGKAEGFANPNGFIVMPVLRFLQLAAAAGLITLTSPAQALTNIVWWHAMSGELGRQVERLAADFNASQSEFRIVPSYKGNYTETVTAAIFAFRSRSQPAIVQSTKSQPRP
jgi:hypothetical protein